jgi:hypothetical protein
VAFCLSRVTTHQMPRVCPSDHSTPAPEPPTRRKAARGHPTRRAVRRQSARRAGAERPLEQVRLRREGPSEPPRPKTREKRRATRRVPLAVSNSTDCQPQVRHGAPANCSLPKGSGQMAPTHPDPRRGLSEPGSANPDLLSRRRSSQNRRGSTTSGQIILMSYTQSVSSLSEPS